MSEKPVFLQGTYRFRGQGVDKPVKLEGAGYTVPSGKTAKLMYFRAGQSSDETINLILTRDGKTMRMFPLGMKSAMHFPLVVQEELASDSSLELQVATMQGVEGTLFVDLGFIELD